MSIKVVIISLEKERICRIVDQNYTHRFFYSREFCDGNFQEAIKQFKKQEVRSKKDLELAPYDEGIIVIDFSQQQIHSMNYYQHPIYKYLQDYDAFIMMEKEIKDRLIENKISIMDLEDEKQMPFLEFFDNKTMHEIHDILSLGFFLMRNSHKEKELTDKNPALNILFDDIREQLNSKIQQFSSLSNIILQPTISPFKVNLYQENGKFKIDELILALIQEGITFSAEEKNSWNEYEHERIDLRNKEIFNKIELSETLHKELFLNSQISNAKI